MKPFQEAILITGVVGLGIWAVIPLSASDTVEAPKHAHELKAAERQKVMPHINHMTTDNVHVPACEEGTPMFIPGKIFVALDSKVIDDKLEIAFEDPQKIIDDAPKNVASALALFRLISACFPASNNLGSIALKNNGCPSIDMRSIVKFHPIEILEKQAEQGSVDAKFQYALSAPLAAMQLKNLGTAGSYEFALHISDLGKRYAEEAAKAGSADAMRYVSRAYSTGKFGPRDMQSAYMYALPLGVVGTSEDSKLISELGTKLTNEQRSVAQISSLGCGSARNVGSLKNPFG